jgi:MFS family permease
LSPITWSTAPAGATPREKRNFLNVQIDGVGIGFATSASPFLPVFLARLGATNTQVGLLTAMPGLTGLVLAILIGRFLQGRRQIVPWFSAGRLLVISSYAMTGLITFVVPPEMAVYAVLAIWALATVPQVVVNVSFSVVMNAVAGPQHRYDLMSRRWTLMGLTSAVTVAVVGQVLDLVAFPINYQMVFVGLSLGGLVSYYFSSHIDLPEAEPVATTPGLSLKQRFHGYANLIGSERPFVSFMTKRFVYMFGVTLGAPLFPLYFVRQLSATDAWIGALNTVQTATMLLGYTLWTRLSKNRGSRFVLLCTVFGMALYPALTAMTDRMEVVVIYAGLAGVFQAGLDLVFFDELMKTVPPAYSATFVSLAQSFQNLAVVASPLLGAWLADQIGLSGALLVSAGLRMAGFLLFVRRER